VEHYVLPDIAAAAGMKAPSERLKLELQNFDGKTISLVDAVYKGKVVIITLAGSWCPTCHDHASLPSIKSFMPKDLRRSTLCLNSLTTLKR